MDAATVAEAFTPSKPIMDSSIPQIDSPGDTSAGVAMQWQPGLTPTAGNCSASKPPPADPRVRLRYAAMAVGVRPSIFQRRPCSAPDITEELNVSVPDWGEVQRLRGRSGTLRENAFATRRSEQLLVSRQSVQKVTKVAKVKGQTSGRTYTSKYRGVHQTFPTKRWEAQFRRNGKPTSLGCFDHEEEASRAYDKMMLWCELHHSSGVKGGITNFDPAEYEGDLPWLNSVTQDELVQALRSDGRRQAAQRMLRQKRDGTPGDPSGGGDSGSGSGE